MANVEGVGGFHPGVPSPTGGAFPEFQSPVGVQLGSPGSSERLARLSNGGGGGQNKPEIQFTPDGSASVTGEATGNLLFNKFAADYTAEAVARAEKIAAETGISVTEVLVEWTMTVLNGNAIYTSEVI